MSKAAVLWTGGKDSALALHRMRQQGMGIDSLVTFAPKQANFKAHPLPVINLQAQSLGLPHRVLEVFEPYRESYIAAIAGLCDEGVDTLITGDIDLVNGMPNWIVECCRGLPVQTIMPLWQADRLCVLRELIAAGFHVVLSCVKRPWFTPEWLGTTIDEECLHRFQQLRQEKGLDLCGENGEYHSLVLNGPGFTCPISLHSPRHLDQGELMYLEIENASLC